MIYAEIKVLRIYRAFPEENGEIPEFSFLWMREQHNGTLLTWYHCPTGVLVS
jgi:hypothetical protein